ncbi:hypothetical protein [Arenibacter sp. H213]|uniref:Uncharacterized protein n=1 Tax=Arenibacter antarcticus TaxID=2040469 RepID=A0ABW5VIT7_9FLAO|nr:hypothetical protein [Arenibacter sp. H213]
MTPKSYLLILSLIHVAMLLGILIFGAITYFQGGELITGFNGDGDIFMYVVPLLAMVSYFGGDFMFNKVLTSMDAKSSLKQKLNQYSQASIIRFAVLEGASFIGLFAYRLNNNIFYLVISVVLILYLLKLRPTKDKIARDLRLSKTDQEHFNQDKKELQ